MSWLWGSSSASSSPSAAAASSTTTPSAPLPASVLASVPETPGTGPIVGSTSSHGEAKSGTVTVKSKNAVWENLAIELVSMAASYALLFFGLKFFMKEMDPLKKQKEASKQAKLRLEQKLRRNGIEPFQFNEYESIVASDVVYPEDLKETFAMIGGLEHVKNEIFDIVALPLRRPELFKGKLLSPPKGILLYGPPGTGKTLIAKAIAKESGASFINLQMSTTMNKWFGESQKLVRATFSLAWKLAPTIIFIDEIDAFLRERGGGGEDNGAQLNMKSEFMALWDGMNSQHNHHQKYVIVIGATNRPWDVDQAILRRMPRQFEISLPNPAQRLDILRIYLKRDEKEHLDEHLRRNLPVLAKLLEGYSGSDIEELCRAAAMIPFREYAKRCRENREYEKDSSSLRPISMDDFKKAMKDVRPTGQAAYDYEQSQAAGGSPGRSSHEMMQGMLQMFAMLQQMQQQQQQRRPNGTEKISPVD